MTRALVTGASSGIGRAMARLLDSDGHAVTIVARSRHGLEETAATMRAATILVADLGTSAGRSTVTASVTDVDILINNAGFGEHAPFTECDPTVAEQMIEVNCTAMVALTRAYLPAMVVAGSGRILNISSVAAFRPGPSMAVYHATKAFELSFSESIAEELHGTGVTVGSFCPGGFTSGFQETAYGLPLESGAYPVMPTSEEMAAAAIRAMYRGTRIAIPGRRDRLAVIRTALSPRRLKGILAP